MKLFELDGLSKIFAGRVALEGFSLALEAGAFVSLLGPSGCGKTTALRLIAGLEAPTAGRIVRRVDPARGEIAFVFQDPTLMPWATVARNVRLPLALRRTPRAEADQAVARALALVGLSEFAQAYPRELSGGMRMRVSLARALVTRPKLMLLDEPFAALDEITRFRLDDELLRAREREGWAAVFVTHSIFESVYLSERVYVMTPRPGRIFAALEIPEPYPRSPEFRTSPRYAALCGRVAEALRAAAEADG